MRKIADKIQRVEVRLSDETYKKLEWLVKKTGKRKSELAAILIERLWDRHQEL